MYKEYILTLEGDNPLNERVIDAWSNILNENEPSKSVSRFYFTTSPFVSDKFTKIMVLLISQKNIV